MRQVVPWSLVALWSIVIGCSSATETGQAQGAGAAGAGATSGSGASSAAGGAGIACDDDGDCPGSSACATVACASGACSTTALPQGTPVFEDAVSGDCKRKVCDGEGSVGEVIDGSDLPNDYDPCTVDACSTDGAPSHVTAADFTPCGAQVDDRDIACIGGVCTGCNNDNDCLGGDACHEGFCDDPPGGGADGTCALEIAAGKVVGDADPEDCIQAVCDATGAVGIDPVADGAYCEGGSFCNPSTCSAGACITGQPPAAGTNLPNQSPGDCQVIVCDGSGGAQSQDDDADVPGDGIADDCVVPACSGGGAVDVPAPQGQSCAAGLGACDGNGSCV